MKRFLLALSLLRYTALFIALPGCANATVSIRGRRNEVKDKSNIQIASVLTGLELIDAMADKKITTLTNNQVIVMSSIPGMTTPSFNINATYTGTAIKSVSFGLENSAINVAKYHVERRAPWSFCGNSGPNFILCPVLGYGTHTVTAKSHSRTRGRGRVTSTVTVTFSIVAASTPSVPAPSASSPAASGATPSKAPMALLTAPIASKNPVAPLTRMAPLAPTSVPPFSQAPVSKAPVFKAPVSAPMAPVSAPMAPISAPIVPVSAPIAPISAPIAPISTAPVSAPIAPISAPIAPISTAPASPPSTTSTLVLTGLNLINSLTETAVTTLTENMEIFVSSIPGMTTPSFNVNATYDSNDIKSVVFGLVNSVTTNPIHSVENNPPWAFCGNGWQDFNACTELGIGTHTITATPKSGPGGTGISGAPISVTFTISAGSPPTSKCVIPQLEGNDFVAGTPYAFKVAEAQGMMIGSTFVVFGGFHQDWKNATNATHTLDVSDPAATWQRVDDLPIAPGLTHGAHVHIGTKIYNCGGYVGGHPGLHTTKCIVYDQAQPLGQRWSTLPAPMPEGRGAGGMFYSSELNAMYYISGAQRYLSSWLDTQDFNSTFMYSFDNPSAGWTRKADLPYGLYGANHMMAVTARDGSDKERHYAFGGQYREDEYGGNYGDVFEYKPLTDVWIRRKSMLYPMAHASSSTIPFGCGFITVAGNTNDGIITSNIIYYSADTDTWTAIGNLPITTNTPICDVDRSTNMLYCETGVLWRTQSYKRRLILPGP